MEIERMGLARDWKGVQMSLVIFVALLLLLDVAAWLWGRDSRDGRDWTTRSHRQSRGP